MPSRWPIPRLHLPVRFGSAPTPATSGPAPTEPTATDGPEPDADLLRVLEAVTVLCDRVVDALEADRAERAALVAALHRLGSGPAAEPITPGGLPPLAATERVLGGTIGPVEAEPRSVDDTTLRQSDAEPEPPTEVEVRSGLEDRWVDGFEVCETVHDEAGIRFRLRRLVDRVVLPDLFTERDVRRRAGNGDGTSPPRVRRWSPF